MGNSPACLEVLGVSSQGHGLLDLSGGYFRVLLLEKSYKSSDVGRCHGGTADGSETGTSPELLNVNDRAP